MAIQMQVHDEERPSIAEGQLMMADGNALTPNVELTIRQLVAEQPRRARVLEQYDLPYCCCGGNPTLSQACAQRGVKLQDVLRDLKALDARYRTNRCDLFHGPLTRERLPDLVRHLAVDHRSYLREELPRLSDLIAKVIKRHGELYPELWELQELCDAIEATIERCILAEERLMILAAALLPAASLPAASLPAVASPESLDRAPDVAELKSEVAGSKEALGRQKHYLDNQLAKMHDLMRACTPPESACNTYRVLLESAHEIDDNVHDYLREVEGVVRLIEY